MRPWRFLPALILAAGCGAPARSEFPAAPPPRNPGDVPSAADPQDNPVVAFIDGRPVTWRSVVDHAMATRGKDLIDKYILWQVRRNRIEEIGIRNTPEDLRRRAQLWIDEVRASAGAEAVKKKLEDQKLTEAQYVERFVANPEFDEHVKNEKAVAYTLLTEASIEIDTVAFTSDQDAAAFAAFAARMPFTQAAEQLMVTGGIQGKVAHWPRYRFCRGLAPDAIASTPPLEEKLLRMKKGETTGVERTSGGIVVVAQVVDTHAADPAPFARIADRVMAEVLRRPPSEAQVGLWLARVAATKRIRYEDRYTPRNQGR